MTDGQRSRWPGAAPPAGLGLFGSLALLLASTISGTSAEYLFGVKTRQALGIEYHVGMAGSVETLASEAMQLPPDQRLTLAHRILSSVEPVASTEIDAAWDTEIRERIARYDAGTVRSIPATEVFAEVDRRLRR